MRSDLPPVALAKGEAKHPARFFVPPSGPDGVPDAASRHPSPYGPRDGVRLSATYHSSHGFVWSPTSDLSRASSAFSSSTVSAYSGSS